MWMCVYGRGAIGGGNESCLHVHGRTLYLRVLGYFIQVSLASGLCVWLGNGRQTLRNAAAVAEDAREDYLADWAESYYSSR